MIRNMIRYAAALAAAVGLGACELEVTNPNAPETERVLASPADAEALIGAYYRRWHDGLYRTLGSFHGMANIQSFQNYSSLANNCQNSRTPFSGAANENHAGNVCAGEQQRVYFIHNEVARVASDFITRLDDDLDLGGEPRNARARSFAEFLRGVSLGYVALFYDSSAVVSPTMGTDPEDCLPGPTGICAGALRSYTEVMDSALAALQRSIDAAGESGGSGFPLETSWIPSPTPFTSAEFVRLVRSYRARLRANVARNSTERAAVDWDAVILDSQNGITEDHLNTTSTVSGPFYTWLAQYDTYGLWHQMPPFIIGMADVTGRYESWIAQPVGQRGQGNASFFMITPDLRFPQGTTRADQQVEFSVNDCDDPATPCKRYFANRTGNDQFAGSTFGHSNYDFVRYHSWRVSGDDGAGQNGDIPFFTKAELDMLEAEGHIRNENFAAAAALINKTRTAGMAGNPPVATGGGLPAITAPFSADAPVPGGADCVPKVPTGPQGPLVCGDIMEAMKWEKRIETAYTHFAAWYLDSRGWDDLAENTPLFWATPFQDLLARVKPIYGAGPGVGTAPGSTAPRSGYGW